MLVGMMIVLSITTQDFHENTYYLVFFNTGMLLL
jgi:hypothetical protein